MATHVVADTRYVSDLEDLPLDDVHAVRQVPLRVQMQVYPQAQASEVLGAAVLQP
ncbi:hypothetical protein [Caldimonas sp.]|uniref:hypothetical protein n=1 Tax=Caldimonas sp. TaxID=2838790 RepID=UPI0039188F94